MQFCSSIHVISQNMELTRLVISQLRLMVSTQKGSQLSSYQFSMAYKNFDCFQFNSSVYSDDCSYGLDLECENLVKGHFELSYATTMLKQTNIAARFCKIRSKVKFSMRSQRNGN